MLRIGDFSKLSRISIRMLRHYDELDLLRPRQTDQATGYRYYGEAQLQTAARITVLREMGFGLSVIARILECYGNQEELAHFLQIRHEEIQEEARESARRLTLIETAMERMRKDETAMKYSVTCKTLPERTVASVRDIIPAYDQEQILWGRLMGEVKGMNLKPADSGYSLAIFHDEGYKESDVDVEIQWPVKGSYPNTEHVMFKTEPSVTVASCVYQGSYEQLTAVNHAVADWVNANGYEFNGTMFCIYHVSPAQTQNPDELVTEVCYPVKKK